MIFVILSALLRSPNGATVFLVARPPMPQSFAAFYVHFVFSTKHREPRIGAELQPRLFEYVGGILRNQDCHLIGAGGMPDHVHLLVSLGRTLSAAETVRLVKSNSSSWLHADLHRPDIGWQDGYGAFSVSKSNIPQVQAYLADQDEHHRRLSFQDEFRELLRRHELEWDERYVWD